MTRKTLCLKVQDTFENMKTALVQKLNNAEYIATTADCWSARQRSYLGVTCRWIDSTSLERCSAALACRRGSVYYDTANLHLLLLLTICVLWYRLNTAELGFLSGYATVMKPVAMALNLLHGKSSVHMGFLLPTLHQLQDKLKRLESTCKVCQPLLMALQEGILKCFGEVMKEPELIAASILPPKFRNCLDNRLEHLDKR